MLTSARVGYDRSGLESTLTISRVEESDGGVYQCRVEQMAYRTVAAANQLLVAQSECTAPLCLRIPPTDLPLYHSVSPLLSSPPLLPSSPPPLLPLSHTPSRTPVLYAWY